MGYVFLAIFIIATVIHLYASNKKDTKLRNITKPFILLSLIGFYLFTASSVSVVITLALVFSWLGDILLIKKGLKWFVAGGVGFLISHFLLIAGYTKDINFSYIPKIIIILIPILFIGLVTFIFYKLKLHFPKKIFFLLYGYLLINGFMNCFAIYRLISEPSIATVSTAVGAALFFLSDTILFFVRFKKDSIFKTHFLVMFTYSIGKFLIVFGLL